MSKSSTIKAAKSMESEIENEDENENISSNRFSFPHSSSSARSPLNAIPDPCQSSGSLPTSARVLGFHKGKGNSAGVQSNSTTPARSTTLTTNSSRVSNIHKHLNLNHARASGGGAGGSAYRGISSVTQSEASVVPHFDLIQDPSFWKDHNVQVLIRIRPLSSMEKVSQGYGTCLKQESSQTLVWLGHPETRFTFDHVACQTISQEKLFRVAGLPMVDNCMSGYNSCMFAYGQTGSGKTFTMMGEIGELDEDCGITPRVFEYLFTRIKEEEENRRSEGLKYSCKCSFLEIYNEQITDLLEPSSTNLQIREDLQKGVYVENLSEYDVRSANDIISLLREGAANRKMAATHMNSESSRSHSVFTCIIESCWEKDSMNHLRFARLNLVDLAGSERQKSSGADGDRLKEAANINKSLSTLGLVIMSLVDLAHGKQRHVPYRDSRLTFLLQDSLGGNSKTTIIANVSPSTCSANETLSTLKFAQRAKLIQNNAKVNEDASGDVTALQRQIQLLKGQLNFLMKHQDQSKRHLNTKESCRSDFVERRDSLDESQQSNVGQELKECKDMNSKLIGEADELQRMLDKHMECYQDEFDSVQAFSIDSNQPDGMYMLQYKDIQKQLGDAKCLMETMESKQLRLIEELEFTREENKRLKEKLNENEMEMEIKRQSGIKHEKYIKDTSLSEPKPLDPNIMGSKDVIKVGLQAKLDKLSEDLQAALSLNNQYLDEHASRLSQDHQIELVRDEVEVETATTILHLQEDLVALETEYEERLCTMEEENAHLRISLAAKEDEITKLSSDWERATLELTNFLLDGSKSLRDASHQIEGIASSFPHVNVWIGEHVEKAAKICIQKEETILMLQRSLEDAQKTVLLMDQKLNSLKDATLVFANKTEQLKYDDNMEENMSSDIVGELERQAKLETEDAMNSFCSEAETYLSALRSDIQEAVFIYKDLLHDLENDIHEAKRNCSELKANDSRENQQQLLHRMKDELFVTNDRLNTMNACMYKLLNSCVTPEREEGSSGAIWFTPDSSILSSNSSADCVQFEDISIVSSHAQESQQVKNFNYNELLMCLRKEFKSALGVFSELNAQLDGLFIEKDSNQGPDQPIMPEMSVNNTQNMNGGDKYGQATSFFTKIEEAHATMEEADHMLKALLQANENANQLSFMWKQAGEDLQFEKSSLIQEIQKLKSSISIREGENESLQEHISHSLIEISNAVALLERVFGHMQKDVEEFCKTVYLNALTIVKESLNSICSSKDMFEEIFTKAMENEITSLFLECHVKESQHKLRNSNTNTNNALSPVTFQCLEIESGENCNMSSEVNFMKWSQYDETSIEGELRQAKGDPGKETLVLKRELERKNVILKGLLFDFRLLQESASKRQDSNDEYKKLSATLNQVQYELQMKNSELDELQLEHRELKGQLNETEQALTIVKSDLEDATILSEENADLRVLVKDLYLGKSEIEDQLDERNEVIKNLEEEILRMASTTEEQLASSVKEDDLIRVKEERDKLVEQLQLLQVRLDMALAFADENEAIAVEARQVSENSRMYAEEKEEEVKILERSVEVLEGTINVLENKVYGMEDEVQRQHLIRDSLEHEIQALTQRLSIVENLTDNMSSDDSNMEVHKPGQTLRSPEVHEAESQIRILKEERRELINEIKQYKEYISELVLLSESQASQYQEKYKHLEAMVHEVKTDVTYEVPTLDKTEKTSTRTRGSGSPFRCISNLVHQMNLEKDQELAMTKARIQELEVIAATRQKEVCILNSRLAAAESMTHDIIRDLLGVKLDMTNYANLADQYQLQNLVEEAQQQKQDSITMENEILNLRRQLDDLTEEREECISKVNRREADVLAAHITLEQLKERDQLLTSQNEMLKMDKTNLQRRIAELDDMIKKLFGTQNQQRIESKRGNSSDFGHSGKQKQLLRVDDELARYRRFDSKQNGHENEAKLR